MVCNTDCTHDLVKVPDSSDSKTRLSSQLKQFRRTRWLAHALPLVRSTNSRPSENSRLYLCADHFSENEWKSMNGEPDAKKAKATSAKESAEFQTFFVIGKMTDNAADVFCFLDEHYTLCIVPRAPRAISIATTSASSSTTPVLRASTTKKREHVMKLTEGMKLFGNPTVEKLLDDMNPIQLETFCKENSADIKASVEDVLVQARDQLNSTNELLDVEIETSTETKRKLALFKAALLEEQKLRRKLAIKFRDLNELKRQSTRNLRKRLKAAERKTKYNQRKQKHALQESERKKQRYFKALKSKHKKKIDPLAKFGLSLQCLMDPDWHEQKRNAQACQHFFGFKTLQRVREHIDELLPDEIYLQEASQIVRDALATKDRKAASQAIQKLRRANKRKQEQVMMCILRMRCAYPIEGLINITGWGKTKVQGVMAKWLPIIGKNSRMMVNIEVTSKFADAVAPQEWKDSPYKNCMLIGDAKDIAIDEPRVSGQMRNSAYSSKINQAALRGLSLMLPNGQYVLVTDLVLAKTTEPQLLRAYAGRLGFLPPDRDILYDKGLRDGVRHALPNLNHIVTPGFLRARAMFTASEVGENRHLAKLRYGVEVGYSRIYNYRFLQDRMPHAHGKYANDVWFYAHYHANLMQAIRR